jgi:hypothetical protein
MNRSLVVVLALASGACNPLSCIKLPELPALPDAGLPSLHGTEDPVQEELVVQGVVSLRPAAGGPASRASGVTVQVTQDRDGNGVVGASERVSTTTNGDGAYRLQVTVTAGQTAVVSFRQEGAATVFRTVTAGPRANLRQNVTLEELQDLACDGTTCAASDSSLRLTGLSPGFQASARVFNPAVQADAFPGDFAEESGKLLISGVFSAVELTDGSGGSVTTLATPAELRMRVPRDTWSLVVDTTPGNGRIDVPMYAFDEVKGTWVREGEGFLESDTGATIPESALPAIRDGSHAGGVVARASVSHFSYWNVDWPVDTKGCVRGVVLDREGQPAEGATVQVSGVTYTGSSRSQTVGPDGRFCVEVMRSEGPGEDVDQDGITGEAQTVAIRVFHRGLAYDGGRHAMPTRNATCTSGECLDVGTIRLSRDLELIPAACTVRGVVQDLQGNGVEGATVMGLDPSMDPEMWMAMCMGGQVTCEYSTQTGADGRFTLGVVMMDQLMLVAQESRDLGNGHTLSRMGTALSSGCPATEVTVVLEMGVESYELEVTVSGNTISWTPAVPATWLQVMGGDGMKWFVGAQESGFPPPVTYGTVPAGAQRVDAPDAGPPAPLASGDTVTVVLGGTSSTGYPLYGQGQVSVP